MKYHFAPSRLSNAASKRCVRRGAADMGPRPAQRAALILRAAIKASRSGRLKRTLLPTFMAARHRVAHNSRTCRGVVQR